MKTVSQAVEEIIQRSPFLAEIIAEGLANNAQVARRLKPEVEKKLLEEVSESSIAMALHRLAKELKRPVFGEGLLKHISGITVRSNLVQFVCLNFLDLSEAFRKISKTASAKEDTFLNFSRGLHESILIVSYELEEEAAHFLGHEKNIKKVKGLSAITMRLPEESLNVPGVYYPVLKAIGQAGISLVEVVSVRTEFSIILDDKDIDRAFSIIKLVTS